MQTITPKHQKQILELEAEIKSIEAKYKENMANAAKETDPAKKAKFVAAAQTAEIELKKVKQKLRNNPLTKLIQYNHLLNYTDDLEKLFRGNVPKQPPTVPDLPNPNHDPSDPRDSNGGTTPTGGQNPWNPWGGGNSSSNNPQQSNQQQLLILAGIAVLVIFFLLNQKEHD